VSPKERKKTQDRRISCATATPGCVLWMPSRGRLGYIFFAFAGFWLTQYCTFCMMVMQLNSQAS
jgi:hypothetical protein